MIGPCRRDPAQDERGDRRREPHDDTGDNMMGRPFARLAAGLLGLVAAMLCASASAQSKVVWKASDVHPLGYPTVEAIVRMGKKLEAQTNGRISIQMYPSMQLGGEKEMIEQAQVGALQI